MEIEILTQLTSLASTAGPWSLPVFMASYAVYRAINCGIDWLKKSKEEKADNIPNTLKRIAGIYEDLSILLTGTNATAVRIMMMSNGGSIPRVGIQMYLTTMYEVWGARNKSIRGSYEKTPIDMSVVRNSLLLMCEDPGHGGTIVWDNIPSDSAIAPALQAVGVQSVRWFEIHKEEGLYYYLQLEFPNEADIVHELMLGAVNRIRRAFEV